MAIGWSREAPLASSELYVDKVVKYISGGLQLLLGVALVIVGEAASPKKVDLLRTYSVIVVLQAGSVLLVLLVWYWCYGQDLANHVQGFLHHANHLTSQYRRYGEILARGGGAGGAGPRREVSEATLHGHLDHFLEYLQHVLTSKAEPLYARHSTKWVVVLAAGCVELIVLVALLASAGLGSLDTYEQALWLLPLLIQVGTNALVFFHCLYDLRKHKTFAESFFYRAIPGAMDVRLSKIVDDSYDPRYLGFLSRHCWQNAHLMTAAGLSESLARKYSYLSSQHRPDRWRDEHFPTLRSDQLERFSYIAQQFVASQEKADGDDATQHGKVKAEEGGRRKWDLTTRSKKVKVGDVGDPGRRTGYPNPPAAPLANPGYPWGPVTKPAPHIVAEDGYMTPHLFARKLARESGTPEMLLEEELAHTQKPKHGQGKGREVGGGGSKSSSRDVPSTGPQHFPAPAARGQLGLSRDDTEVDYGAFYQPHDPDPHRMKREYDPLTYSMRLSVRKEMAKDSHAWR